MTHMIELVDKYIKRAIIHIFHIFKKVMERVNMVSSNIEDILKDLNQASRVETTMSSMKNTTKVINIRVYAVIKKNNKV